LDYGHKKRQFCDITEPHLSLHSCSSLLGGVKIMRIAVLHTIRRVS
jgi:hypothetical protein